MIDIVAPTLSESVTEAMVAKWMKKTGDTVRKGERRRVGD
jgi:2-oxoglutarate dehydrogenase E2 component (dihydrolipoamide succinyltransferase)